MRKNYAKVLFRDPSATIDDLREAVTTLYDVYLIAPRVLGGENASGHSGHRGNHCERARSAPAKIVR